MNTTLTKHEQEAMLAKMEKLIDERDTPFAAFRLGFEAAIEMLKPELEAYVDFISGEINNDELEQRLKR